MSGVGDFRRILWLHLPLWERELERIPTTLGGWGENTAPPVMDLVFPETALCKFLVTPHRPLFLGEFFLNDYGSSFTPFPCLSISSPWHIPDIFLEIQKLQARASHTDGCEIVQIHKWLIWVRQTRGISYYSPPSSPTRKLKGVGTVHYKYLSITNNHLQRIACSLPQVC